ncbi:hypothetical protein KIN20_011491 [Parelaphostrongylus tenuis]|uniref:Uncharacterized protein n=1 Tax=Parelaphostrongylus tenuis TaxID=148309 RepID=A0AAD5MTP3_PARTN|nr:hypothetical protein KIN20_011491 [Parelaphostrongylus tenuis]
MVYDGLTEVSARAPGIATSEAEAHAFVQCLAVQTTTNIIMANWSKAMWQNAVNKAVRMLASGPYASQFFSESAMVGGN